MDTQCRRHDNSPNEESPRSPLNSRPTIINTLSGAVFHGLHLRRAVRTTLSPILKFRTSIALFSWRPNTNSELLKLTPAFLTKRGSYPGWPPTWRLGCEDKPEVLAGRPFGAGSWRHFPEKKLRRAQSLKQDYWRHEKKSYNRSPKIPPNFLIRT